MSNLIITSACNRDCTYCFASEKRNDDSPRFLKTDDFNVFLDYLDNSGIDQARIMGGEPSLHPEFAGLLRKSEKRQKNVMVFSNGMMSSSALDALSKIKDVSCQVMVNINETGDQFPKEAALQRRTFERLGANVMPAFTICRYPFQMTHLLEMINAYGLMRKIRVSLAHPILMSKQNVSPKRYRSIGGELARFAVTAQKEGVRLVFDCGFPICMFSAEDIENLKKAKAELRFECRPVVDVDTAMNAHYCYPLASVWQTPLEKHNRQALLEWFEIKRGAMTELGIFRECATCSFKALNTCAGGCLATTLKRFVPVDFSIEVPADE
ncbi:MAG: radical SAM protein [Deltaproteobacteria bacterium]|nr:radical SAM protein [Deltaproteobacteria bacterium]